MPLTEDYTFMLGDNGVILNTDSNLVSFVDLTKIDGLDSPDFRETLRDHEGQDGGFMDAEFERAREVSLEGTIYCSTETMESYLDSLKSNWAPSRTLLPLYFYTPGVGERVLFVKPRGVRYSWDTIRRTGQSEVRFGAYAEDPRIYGIDLITSTVPLGGTVEDGFGFDLGFPFGFGDTVVAFPSTNVLNNGNRNSPPIIRIFGPVTNPEITNVTTGITMRFSCDLLSGQTLVIDTKNRTILLNGVTSRRNFLITPFWIELVSGVNTIRYVASSTDPSTYLQFEYRYAWR